MDIRRKTCDNRTLKNKHSFIDIWVSSTNTDTFVPPLYHFFETRSREAFRLLSQLLPHNRFIICDFRTSLRECLDSVVNRFMRQTLPTVKRKYFFMNILCIESFCSQKKAKQNAVLGKYTPQARSFWLLKPASAYAHARLLLRLLWSWTVLLPSDTCRKLTTSITAVLLPFVTYLLILPRVCWHRVMRLQGKFAI
jgi:hypothetical protein